MVGAYLGVPLAVLRLWLGEPSADACEMVALQDALMGKLGPDVAAALGVVPSSVLLDLPFSFQVS